VKGRERGRKGEGRGTEGRAGLPPPPNWGVWIRQWRRGKGRRVRRRAA